jgi:6-phosphogluconate dehydrogenase
MGLEIAVIGANRSWGVLARRAGFRVLGRALGDAEAASLSAAGVELASDYPAFFDGLEFPRLHILDLPPGRIVDEVIDTAYVTMEPGDLVVDASESYWGDSLRRWRRMRHRSIFYLDLARIDDALLIAGDARGVELARPRLERLAGPGPLLVAGEAGAAHFAAMVRDGVGTALAQLHGEAQQVLEAYPGVLDAKAVLPRLVPAVTAGGRGGWLIDDALQLQAAIPALAQAIMLQLADALDAQQLPVPLPRLGPFVRPDDLG